MPPVALPDSVGTYWLGQQRVSAATLALVKRLWLRMGNDFDDSWDKISPTLVAAVEQAQLKSAELAAEFVPTVLDEQGLAPDVLGEVVPDAFVGVTGGGVAVEDAMYRSVITSKSAVGSGMTPTDALSAGADVLQALVQTLLSDTGRAAESVGITARPGVGFVRMLNPPSCARCVILAGRFYRWSSGFKRHPRCDCRHVPSTQEVASQISVDPDRYFRSLTNAQQDKAFGPVGAQAIRDGADIGQVVNADRGMQVAQVYGRELAYTTEGTTKRGVAGKVIRARGRDPRTTPRLMPEAIYEIAESREDALRLLRLNGYVLDRSGPVSGAGSRTGLVPDLSKPTPVPTIDLDRVQADAVKQRELTLWLAAEERYRSDVATWLDAEAQYRADVDAWLAAEASYEATRLVSRATRELVDQSRVSLPQGQPGWALVRPTKKDANGQLLPSDELLGHLGTVTSTGRAIRLDIARRLDADVALAGLRVERDHAVAQAKSLRASGAGFAETMRWDKAANTANRKVARIESAAIREALAEVRGFGGREQDVRLLPSSDVLRVGSDVGEVLTSATQDTIDIVRAAEQYFPTAWLDAADSRGPLYLAHVHRAFFRAKGGELQDDMIASSPRKSDPDVYGAHPDTETEVMVHELGHRMEKAIPGLMPLEFALARSRATVNGSLEPVTEMYYPGSGEMTYKDDWGDPYTGRSYASPYETRPDRVPHEVFQTGTQDLFGRGMTRYAKAGDPALEEFMMGVLALL